MFTGRKRQRQDGLLVLKGALQPICHEAIADLQIMPLDIWPDILRSIQPLVTRAVVVARDLSVEPASRCF